ncbi:MAG: EAL domain-containing protein [Bacillota bacterium]
MQVLWEREQQDTFNISDVIKNKKITVHFQPVISPNRKKVLGLEGLVRGLNTETNQLIPPILLFDAAQDAGVTLELDRLCREMVLEAFTGIYEDNKDKLLFLNIDASILDKVAGSKFLLNQVNRHKINPNNVVIEVNEIKVQDNAALRNFIDIYRENGFLIALDDVGAGFSNLNRIPLAKPDIIKTDMSLIRNIHNDYHKQEVFKSMINLANTIGALVVAEGVETEEEAIQILRHGGHMIQGFYFSRPQEMYRETDAFLGRKIEILNNSFKEYMNFIIKEEEQRYEQLNTVMSDALMILVRTPEQHFDNRLAEIVHTNENIECAYILDAYGIQVGKTISGSDVKENPVFYLARTGTDHSMKKYYYRPVNAKLNKYITEPYVSLATGNLCITYSKVFRNIENEKYILCIDFKAT